MMFGKYYK